MLASVLRVAVMIGALAGSAVQLDLVERAVRAGDSVEIAADNLDLMPTLPVEIVSPDSPLYLLLLCGGHLSSSLYPVRDYKVFDTGCQGISCYNQEKYPNKLRSGGMMATLMSMKINGKKLRAARYQKLLDIGELAEKSGLNRDHISRLEHGTWAGDSRPSTVRKLSKALEVEPAELLE